MSTNGRNGVGRIFSLVCLAGFAVTLPVQAQQNPPVCVFSVATVGLGPFCNSNATASLLGQQVVVGQTIYYQASVSQSLDINCGFEGGQILITLPDGTVTNVTPDGGIPLVCGSPGCSPAGVPVVLSKVVPYTVRAADIGVNQAGFLACPATNIQATVTYTGGTSHCDAGNTCDPSAATSLCNPARVVSLVVEKAVACVTGQVCDASLSYGSSASGAKIGGDDPEFCYRFIYRNTGTAALVVTSAVDTVLGTLATPVPLPPGAVVTNFSGPVTHASTTVDTLSVLAAQTSQACFSTTIVASASAQAQVIPASIRVTKQCNGGPFKIGDPIQFTGTVTNTGNATLVGITVIDDKAGDVSSTLSATTLAPGQSATYSGSFPSSGNGCGPFTNTLTAQARVQLVCGGTVQATTNNICTVITSPGIAVTKMCDGGPFKLGDPIKFKGTVTNTGDVTLVSVTVSDNHAGTVLSGVTLAPGASTNYSGSYVAAGCGPFTNTVTATGLDLCTGGQVQAQAQAICTVITSPGIAVTKMCDGGPFKLGDPIKFKGTVTNTGDVTLVSVSVSDNHAGTVLSGVTLAPGASTNYSGSYVAAGCGPFTNTVTATGLDLCTGGQVQAQAQAVCTVITSPGIAVTKMCESTNGMIQIKGTVTNTGDVALVSVAVSDDHAGTVLSGVTLPAGASTNYSGSYGATSLISTDVVTATGIDLCTGGQVRAQAMAICGFNPCIQITKSVACNATGTNCSALANYGSVAQGAKDATHIPKFCFRYAVTNCGDQIIVISNVTDTAFGDITGIGFPNTLAPKASTNVFLSADLSESEINFVQLAGSVQNAPGLGPVNSSSTATAQVLQSIVTCDVVFKRGGQTLEGNVCVPGTKDVGVVAGGGPVDVHVVVCADSGNQQSLTNCVITVSGINGPIVVPIPGVAVPGGCSDTLVATLPDMPSMYMVRADISCEGVLTHGCGPIQTVCSNSVEICGTNCISVVKLVKCADSNECLQGVCSANLGQYGPSATGARDAEFCYGVVISNCGQLDFASISVSDMVPGVGTTDISGLFAGGLAAGQSKTNFYNRSYPGFVGTKVNTVTVLGSNAFGTASASANASVQLLAPQITCDKYVSLNGGAATAGGTFEVPAGSTNNVVFIVRVTNSGSVDLQNVQVIDTGTAGCPASTNVIAFLAKGDFVDVPVCAIEGLTCPPQPTTISNVVNVTAKVADNVCGVDAANCQRISVTSSCSNVITLTCKLACITRTPGYWFTHWRQASTNCATLEAAIKANGGKLDIGFMCLDGTTDEVLSKALGIFWSKRNRTSDGSASSLCRARKQLAFHLIAAIANTTLLGTDPSGCTYQDSSGATQFFPSDLISQAQKAAACGNIGQIHQMLSLLDAFNNSGDNAPFPPGLFPCKADPRGAKRFKQDPTTTLSCNDLSHCTAGKSCP